MLSLVRLRLHAERDSCRDCHALNADELQFARRSTLDLKAKLNGFADSLRDLVKRAPLRVAARKLRHRSYKVAFCIAFNHDIEL